MEKITNLPKVEYKRNMGGDLYYKVTYNDAMSFIAVFFNKLRKTGYMDEVKRKLNSTSFLEGVSGNVLIFKVDTDFMGRESMIEERGVWIHQSLLYPFIIMSSVGGLHFMVQKFDNMIRKIDELENDSKVLALRCGKLQEENSALLASLKAYQDCDEEVEVDDYGFIKKDEEPEQLALPLGQVQRAEEEGKRAKIWLYADNSKKYYLSYINKGMKKSAIQWGPRGPIGDTSKECYKDRIMKLLVMDGYVNQVDVYHFTIPNEYKDYFFTYIPRNQTNAAYNESKKPVQYYGFTKKGVEAFLTLMAEKQIIEPIEFHYIDESKA